MYPYLHFFSCSIPSYGAMLTLGIIIAGTAGIFRAMKVGLRWEDVLLIGVCGLGTGFFGAGALYGIVTYGVKQLFQLFISGQLFYQPWGLVFYGGIIGAVPGVLLGARIANVRLRPFIPPLLPCIPLAHAFGRVGCFLAGCCYGAPTNAPIGVVYTQSLTGVPTGVPLLPVQLWEAALLLALACLLFLLSSHLASQQLIGVYALLYGILRFCLEFFRYDSIRGLWFGLSTSQWISISMCLLGIGLLSLPCIACKQNPGIAKET